MPEDPHTPPAPPVSPDAIEAANVANILGQLAAGKPISAAQQKLVTDYQRRQLPLDTAAPTAPAPRAPRARPAAGDFSGQVADTMTAAGAMTGYSEEDLSRAKSAGCPAFRGSRVYLGELVAWLEANPEILITGDSDLDDVTLQIARERHRRIRFENDAAEGRYILAADLAPRVEQYGRDLLYILRRILEDEAPARQASHTAEELLPINRAIVDTITDSVRSGARRLLNTTTNQ